MSKSTTRVSPSLMERLAGDRGSVRRYLSWLVCAFLVSTVVRDSFFRPQLLGQYLSHTLAPVERDNPKWYPILATRVFDLVLGSYLWHFLEGKARREGVLFGLLVAGLSRSSLYAFEHAYFLLSIQTCASLLLIDLVSLASGFALLPQFLPHSVEAHPPVSLVKRLEQDKELVINIIFAYTLGTAIGAFPSFVLERKGGLDFVRARVTKSHYPSHLANDVLTAAQQLAKPFLDISVLRSSLHPQIMLVHLGHCFATALLSIPLVIIMPRLNAARLALVVFAMIAVPSVVLLWDVLPISFEGALGVGLTLALRGAVTTAIVAWILEELRIKRYIRIEHERSVVVDDQDNVVAVVDKDTVIEEEEQEIEVTKDGIRKRHPRA